jgi:uncharacterized protein YeaC (DUF1315 family)
MHATLVEQFAGEELTPDVRQLLREAMKRGPDGCKLRDELHFNRFNVLLDYQRGVATINDELDVSQAGTVEMLIADFERLIA